MGLIDKWREFQAKMTEDKAGEDADGRNMSGEGTVTLSDLIGTLDRAGQELGRSSILSREQIAEYAGTLNDMKRSLRGVLDARTNPSLLKVLEVVFSVSLLQTFQFGSPSEIKEAENTAFDGIKAITAPEKEQVIVMLNLQILTLQSERQKNRHWISEYTADQDKARQSLDELRRRTDIPIDEMTTELTKLVEALNQLEYTIAALKKENDSVEITILQKQQQLREVKSDLSASSLRELRKMIDEFNSTLPTAEELYQAVGNIEKLRDQDLAAVHSKSSMLLRALGKQELTVAEVVREAEKAEAVRSAETLPPETDSVQIL